MIMIERNQHNMNMRNTVKDILLSQETELTTLERGGKILSESGMQDLTIAINGVPEGEIENLMTRLDGLFTDMGMSKTSQSEADEKVRWLLSEMDVLPNEQNDEEDVCVNCGSDFSKGVLDLEDNCPDCGKPWNTEVADEPEAGPTDADLTNIPDELLDLDDLDDQEGLGDDDALVGIKDLIGTLSTQDRQKLIADLQGTDESQIQKRDCNPE